MRPYKSFWALLALLLVVGCATSPMTPQEAVKDAYETLLAARGVIDQNIDDGIYTKEQAQKYLDRVKELTKQVKAADDLVRNGIPNAAQQAELANKLARALHKEVVARARAVQ